MSAAIANIVVGMAGAGKTTFMQRLNSHLHLRRQRPYVLNLDPAVLNLPYETNIDIRDTINYKEVMKQYNLGPNGGILTSLNLFTTKFDQVLGLLEKRAAVTTREDSSKDAATAAPITHMLFDTPGQIEIFTWSASGAIITDSLASSFPTVLTYIIDSPRSTSCSTFISSMLYAVSILYKTKLPMIIVFNKIDVEGSKFEERIEWMRDFEVFQAALRKEEEEKDATGRSGSGYMNSLMNSMSLVLEEFYSHLDVVGVSSLTGEGFDEYLAALERKKVEYESEYKPELEALRKEREEKKQAHKAEQLKKLISDMAVDDSDSESDDPAETISEQEDNNGELEDPDEDEEFESVEDPRFGPHDPEARIAAAQRKASNQQFGAGTALGQRQDEVNQLAELMNGIGSLKQARAGQ